MWRQFKKKIVKKYLNKLLGDGRTACISCGYSGEDLQEEYPDLYRGYGCPRCYSPLVVKKCNGMEVDIK